MRHLNDPPPSLLAAALLICLNTFADFAAKWERKKRLLRLTPFDCVLLLANAHRKTPCFSVYNNELHRPDPLEQYARKSGRN
jgi:hypothetical protein